MCPEFRFMHKFFSQNTYTHATFKVLLIGKMSKTASNLKYATEIQMAFIFSSKKKCTLKYS